MGVHRLNHAVLFVSDLSRSVAFHTEVLGLRRVAMTPGGFAGARTRGGMGISIPAAG
ncbi:VOC family protein [Rhizomonospora bruguierae]|uniref:VOC family protein n=1 Tax=Rhizomonospora bruguierae TaxID=1581705 RepID=UPI001BD06080|nr:VOC family protein [Micromonospora sp. NBRC 107566]